MKDFYITFILYKIALFHTKLSFQCINILLHFVQVSFFVHFVGLEVEDDQVAAHDIEST